MKKQILSIVLILCMLLSVIPMTVSAADASVDAPLTLTYIGTNCTTDAADVNAKMLLDGKTNTKWCTKHALPLTITFRTDGKTVVKSMQLYSANDTSNANWAGRNWKAWSLYGWDASNGWVEIQSWSEEKPQTTYGECSTYAITNDTAYDKYQLEISANWGGDVYGFTAQMAEMKLIGHAENQTTYTVTYNSNGGSTVSSATGRTTLPTLPVPTKSEFDFIGWYTDEALTKEAKAGDAISQDTTLYARWGNKTSSLALTFISSNDDRTTETPKQLIDGIVGNAQNKWCTKHELPLTLEFSTATNTVVKSMELYPASDTVRFTKRNWKAWSLYGLDSTGAWVEIQSWSNQTPTTDFSTFSTYEISNNTSYEKYQLVISASYGPDEQSVTAQMAEMKLYGYNQSYAITYELNGGTNGDNPVSYTYGTGVASFANATRDGYLFDGWYDAAEGGNQITTVLSTATGDKTLYAHWSRDYGTNANYYKAYDVVVSKDGISFKFLLDQTGHSSFVRCDMQLRTGNSSTDPLSAFPENMIDYYINLNGFVKTNATPPQAKLDIDKTENIASITIYSENLNISEFLTEETPYVWLYIRPCWWKTAYDNSTKQGIAYYNDIVYLGKYSSNKNFQNGIEDVAGTVTIDSGITNGTVSVAKATKFEGEKVVLKITPDSGYGLDTLTYTPEGGTPTAITRTDGVYSFTMPNGNVTVNAIFAGAKVVNSNGETSYYNSLAEAISNSENGDTVVMLVNSDENITIPSGKDITLDLNGFTLTTTTTDSAITNNGTLTIKDSSDEKTGTITGGTVNNGGVYNTSSGTLNLESGTITGFTTDSKYTGAGVKNEGTFNMSGGTISKNTDLQSNSGGGVYNTGTFTITGGIITENKGLYVGGVYSKGQTRISGNPKIRGNIRIENNTENNVYLDLYAGKLFDIIGEMTGEYASIGIYIETNLPTAGKPVAVTSANDADYSNYFTSDNESYAVICDGTASNRQVKLSVDYQAKTVKSNGTTKYYASLSDAISNAESGDTVVMLVSYNGNITIPQGKNITLDLNGEVLKGTGSGSVIINNGTLNIKDSNPIAVHKYVVGSDGLWTWNDSADGTAIALENLTARATASNVIAVKGGAITGGVATDGGGIYNTGTLTMSSGNIVGCKASSHGGGVANIPNTNATFAMTGGAIIGCIGHNGGGVSNDDGRSFTMSDTALISNCMATYVGGGVCSTGTFNMNGGTIADCEVKSDSNYGGGVCNGDNGTFTMAGGTITRCKTSANNGGGVVSSGIFTITGGTISDCTAVGDGGGVRIDDKGSFTMTGGTIKNCTSNGNGGGIHIAGTKPIVTIGGSAVITGNKKGSAANNLYLPSGKTVSVNAPTSMTVGVTTATAPTATSPVIFTKNGGAYASNFFSDNTSYRIGTNGTEAIVAVPSTVTVSGIINATVTPDKTSAALGEKVVLTVTPKKGFTLDTITYTPAGGTATAVTQTDGVYSFIMPNGNVTVNATFVSDVKVTKDNGDTSYYASLADAISNSASGDTIVLLANTNENITIPSGKELTLDLNGYVLMGDGTNSVITNNGTLTIKDSNPTAIHKFVVGSDGLWTWNDDADGTATAFENLTARPATNAVIAVKGGAITGGVATNGGGINNTGSLTLNGVNVIGNKSNGTYKGVHADYFHDNGGGGIYSAGTLNATESIISGNYAAVSGGGIYSENTLDIDGSYIAYNTSIGNVEHGGAGLYLQAGNATIDDSFIDRNSGYCDGVGMFVIKAIVTVNNTSLCGNINGSAGGAVRVRSADYTSANVTFNNCNLSNNIADHWGGAVNANGSGPISFIGCTFDGNVLKNKIMGKTNGGALSMGNNGTLLIDNCTITNNVNENNGSYAASFSGHAKVTIKDTTIKDNSFVNGGAVEHACDSLTLKGKVIITDNFKTDGTESNLYIPSGKKVIIDSTTPLVDGASIGVTTAVLPASGSPVQFTTKGENTDVMYFFSDNDAYGVNYNESGYLELVIVPEAVKNATYMASLTLGKNIDVNFKMGNIIGDVDGKLYITVDGNTADYQFENSIASCVLKAVEAKDIDESIHIAIIYDGVKVKDFNYSVEAYCDAVYNHASYGVDSTLGKLCTAILNYGKYAEDYANGNTESKLNEGHELDLSTVSLPESKKVFTANKKLGAEGSGAFLTLGSTIKLNYLVKTDDFEYILTLVEDMNNADAIAQGKYKTDQKPFAQNFFILTGEGKDKKQIDPAKISVSEADGGYLISVDLYAYQLSKEYTLKAKGVDLKEFEITFGVYDYCVAAQTECSEAVAKLCKAIYNYSEAVKAYTAE